MVPFALAPEGEQGGRLIIAAVKHPRNRMFIPEIRHHHFLMAAVCPVIGGALISAADEGFDLVENGRDGPVNLCLEPGLNHEIIPLRRIAVPDDPAVVRRASGVCSDTGQVNQRKVRRDRRGTEKLKGPDRPGILYDYRDPFEEPEDRFSELRIPGIDENENAGISLLPSKGDSHNVGDGEQDTLLFFENPIYGLFRQPVIPFEDVSIYSPATETKRRRQIRQRLPGPRRWGLQRRIFLSRLP